MASNPPALTGRPAIQESLLAVARQLDEASSGDAAAARAAVRAATLAVEHRLDLLSGPHGLGAEVAETEPRLLHALDKLEADLAALLVGFWRERDKPGAGSTVKARLHHLAEAVRHVASAEYDIVYEALISTSVAD
ncbi:MAG: hypothetical protein HY875_14040 [Chloroflexi bacterium]|nr:hypothetical protein [Chloroflexota bacterium]